MSGEIYVPPPPPPGVTVATRIPRKHQRYYPLLIPLVLIFSTVVFLVLRSILDSSLGSIGLSAFRDGNSTSAYSSIPGTGTPGSHPTGLPSHNPTPVPTGPPVVLPTKVPTQPPPTPVPGMPTPTPIPYARAATITLTHATQSVSAPSTLVAAVSGGDIPAQNYAPSTTQSSGNITSSYMAATYVSFTISVTNHSYVSGFNAGGLLIHSLNSGLACITSPSSFPVAAQQTRSMTCKLTTAPVPSAGWDDTTHPSLEFKGASPAGGNAAYWYVPATCASDHQTALQSAAQQNLQQQLASEVSGTPFYGPSYSYSPATCSPAANYSFREPFNYSVSLSGSASETTYLPSLAITLQQQRLAAAAQSIGQYWDLATSSVCATPSASAIDSQSATITCPATGVAAFGWTSSYESQVAALLAGETMSAAEQTLAAIPGISGTPTISLSGGTLLPNSPSAITFVVQ
jgi:hypothetical protein